MGWHCKKYEGSKIFSFPPLFSVVFFVVSRNLVIPSSIRKSNERANGALLFRSFNLFAQVVNGFKH